MFLLVVFNFRASFISRHLWPPWDLLSPVLVHIFMEEFETSSLHTSDTARGCAIWMIPLLYGHMADALQDFRTSYNTSTSNIKFTMQVEDHKISLLAPTTYTGSPPIEIDISTSTPSTIGQPHPRTTRLQLIWPSWKGQTLLVNIVRIRFKGTISSRSTGHGIGVLVLD